MRGESRFSGLVRREWYAALLASELGDQPVAVEVLGEPFVLYRDQSGKPVAHLDRCPHRNVPLSMGRCRADGTLECAYHGWRFDREGKCVAIPGSRVLPKANHRVETFATIEQYGVIFLCPDESGRRPESGPLSLAPAASGEYTTIVRRVQFPGGLHAVLENALDVPHTAILHRGLFRGGERQTVDVVLRRYRKWAEAEFIGEKPPTGLVARLLSLGTRKKGALTVQHWDRFLLPSVLQVEYKLGGSHFLITGFCTPIDEENTALFAVVSIKTPLFSFLERLLVRLILPFALKVVAQDVGILEAQTHTMKRFGGERFMSTEIDILGPAITRLLKEAKERATSGADQNQQADSAESQAVGGADVVVEGEEPREVVQMKIDA